MMCDEKGIVYNFEFYTGKVEHSPLLPDVGASGNVVLRLSSIIPREMNYKIYFDNWFTGTNLVIALWKMGIQALGTVRPNRLRGCEFIDDKVLKKNRRGSLDEKTALHTENNYLSAIKWYDNKAVHLLSSYVGAYPMSQVKRFDAKKKVKLMLTALPLFLLITSSWEV